jgi:uncharacterized protein (UPF0332 family)
MIGETISKAARSAKVARALLDGGDFDDAVSRAYYSAFNTARALVAMKNPEYATRTHGGTLGEFSRLFVKTGLLPKEFGQRINRAESARKVADYEGDEIDGVEAEKHVSFAEELLEKAVQLIPSSERPLIPNKKPQDMLAAARAEEAVKHALAKAFCDLATKRGESVHPGLASELVLYGTETDINDLIVNIGEMNDLNSYLKSRVTLPSLG